MPELELALDVVDLVTEGDHRLTPPEIEAGARRLLKLHPEVDVDRAAVAEAISQEERAVPIE